MYCLLPLDCQKEIRETLKKFGFAEFRPGQREVIERILNGLSVLYVQSTGSGKSLCYQLPAYIYWNRYKAVTMVISPLVSLMEDQVGTLCISICKRRYPHVKLSLSLVSYSPNSCRKMVF